MCLYTILLYLIPLKVNILENLIKNPIIEYCPIKTRKYMSCPNPTGPEIQSIRR